MQAEINNQKSGLSSRAARDQSGACPVSSGVRRPSSAVWRKDDPRSLLLPYQADFRKTVLIDRERFIFELWARQTGKDFTASESAIEDCHLRKKVNWSVIAPSERQSLETMDKGKEWAQAFKMMIEDYQEFKESIHPESMIKSAEIKFPNGSKFRALPGRPQTVRGISSNMIFTEFAHFDDAALVWRAAYPSITNPLRGGAKSVIIITTPNGKDNKAYDLWCKTKVGADEQGIALLPDKKIRWVGKKVTIHDAIAAGLPLDLEELREGMEDPDGFAQEYECAFLDGSNVLLPYDLLALAESADATESADLSGLGPRSTAVLFCGIDFGRQNDPTVCWTLEQIGDILWTREVLVLKTISSPDQQRILKSRIAAARRTCFDYTGPGIGLGDYLVEQHHEWKPEQHKFGKVELCTFTQNFKRELFPRLRRKFESPVRIRIPISRVIREDLHEMKQVITNGQYNYWSPRTRDGHSDRCTALALCVRAAGGASSGPFAYTAIGHQTPDARYQTGEIRALRDKRFNSRSCVLV
jgi:phage FluMu gp28-like protein